MDEKIKVSIVGGSGYTGIELLRILSLHPNVDIHHITSRNDAGSYVYEVYPSLRGVLNHKFISPDEINLKESDLVFFATPTGVAMEYAEDLINNGIKVIDLAADFRIKNIKEWEKWYEMPHKCPDILPKAVYGLPEVNREKIKNAQLIANPGCYPTAIQLALIPLLKEGLIDPLSIIADVKSKYKVQDITIQKTNAINTPDDQNKINFGNVRDVEWQNKVITDYLSDTYALDDALLDTVRHINRNVHSKLPTA